MPESSDLSLIADRVGKAGFPYALPLVKTYWLWYEIPGRDGGMVPPIEQGDINSGRRGAPRIGRAGRRTGGFRFLPRRFLRRLEVGVPRLTRLEDGVEDDQRLAHARHQRHLARLAARCQALVQRLQRLQRSPIRATWNR